MNRNIFFAGRLWFLVLLLVCGTSKLGAYDVVTHRAIAERAVDTSSLNGHLQTKLGFQAGTAEIILGQSVRDRIGFGARFEDEPSGRVLNHFHNPLQPWGQAGLTVPLLGQVGQSSVLWGQNPNQDPGGTWSWSDARKRYVAALTKPGIRDVVD
jgi:hypothetical protein